MIRGDSASASGPASVGIAGDAHGPVTATHIGTLVLGVSSMPLTVAAKDPRPVFTAADVDAFTGREWLAGEVDRFIAGNPCGYVFIEAEAGLGKTAFAAWLVKTRGYLSHFSRYSGGRSVQVALANLSAQLITQFGLDDQAPGGMLPEWAQTPGGFESLLAAAAERAQRASDSPWCWSWTGWTRPTRPRTACRSACRRCCRTGCTWSARTGPAGHPGGLTLRRRPCGSRRKISATSATSASTWPRPSARRSWRPGWPKPGMDPAEFTGLLAERCGGVWVYLRYVLNELRFGLRRPDEISDLPSGAARLLRRPDPPLAAGPRLAYRPASAAGHPRRGRGSTAGSVAGPAGRQRRPGRRTALVRSDHPPAADHHAGTWRWSAASVRDLPRQLPRVPERRITMTRPHRPMISSPYELLVAG